MCGSKWSQWLEIEPLDAGLEVALVQGMETAPKLIGVRHIESGGRRIPVLLFQNEGGSVAGRCLLNAADMPIIDGPNADEVMKAIEDALEGLLLARARS